MGTLKNFQKEFGNQVFLTGFSLQDQINEGRSQKITEVLIYRGGNKSKDKLEKELIQIVAC